MKRHRNEGLAHLKWSLINQKGLTPDEASKRIKKMEEWLEKNERRNKADKKV